MSEFKIGATTSVYDFLPIDQLLPNADVPIDPDPSFQPYAAITPLGDGLNEGNGFPIAIWRFNHLSRVHRAILKTLCPGASANLYIRTPTNELDAYDLPVFKSFACIMHWPPEDEDIQIDQVLSLVFRFTHLVEVLE